MDHIKGYELVLGAVLIISLIIGGFGAIWYSPENFIPREKVCIAPYIHEGGLAVTGMQSSTKPASMPVPPVSPG